MGVKVLFECGGCDATAEGTDTLRKGFESFSGRMGGFGTVKMKITIDDVSPEGWIAFDPWTYCTYCPECWAGIITPDDAEVTEVAE